MVINHTNHIFRNFFNWTWTFREDSDIKETFGPMYISKLGLKKKSLPELKNPKGTKLEL